MVSLHWYAPRSELSFVIRSLAGLASRVEPPVSVLVPGPVGPSRPDGAFDPLAVGVGGRMSWPREVGSSRAVIVDDVNDAVAGMLVAAQPRTVLYLETDRSNHPMWRRISLVGADDRSAHVGVHVPVNQLAGAHRHHGFGFTDYTLVLGGADGTELPSEAAWLTAADADADIVVVFDGLATAWRGRAKRGVVSVHTRMDLWRLMAHASACIDLAPGPLVARECIEALRLGTPIIVPDVTGPAAAHAEAGGGWTFGDPAALLDAAARLRLASERAPVAAAGRKYADDRYGRPDALLTPLAEALNAA